MSEKFNLAEHFVKHASEHPEKIAISWHGRDISFGDFLTLFQKLHHGLRAHGFRKGDRVLVLLPVSVELYALFLALLSLGVVCVSIDVSMPREKMLEALKLAKPKAIFSVARVLKFRYFLPRFFSTDFYSIDSQGFKLHAFQSLLGAGGDASAVAPKLEAMSANDPALMTYTTGSTGKPKAANRASGILLAQHEISRDLWPHSNDEIDMPSFPMVGLQNLSCGITTVLPNYDFRALDSIPVEAALEGIREKNVSRLSGPPSVYAALTERLISQSQTLPQIRSLVTGGATVPRWLCEKIVRAFPNATAYIVYGSTEAEPMSYVEIRELLASSGRGYLVGKPIEQIELRIISEGELKLLPDHSERFQPSNTVGEIVARGPHVVRAYQNDDTANLKTKISDERGGIWHRTGDAGYFDEQGRLWLVGRLNDRIRVDDRLIANYEVEAKLEMVEGVTRIAAVNTAGGVRVFFEGTDSPIVREKIAATLKTGFQFNAVSIECLKKIPVDHRHFWKIDRNKLSLN